MRNIIREINILDMKNGRPLDGWMTGWKEKCYMGEYKA